LLDDQGRRMCIQLNSSMWGQNTASAAWDTKFASVRSDIGWDPMAGVPYAFRFVRSATTTDDGTVVPGHDAIMLVIVDDYIISESSGYEIGDRTHAAIRAAIGDTTSEHEPNSFTGMSIARSATTGAITISMPQKIKEAVRTHFPDLLDATAAMPVSEGNAKMLKSIADEMKLAALVPHAKTGRAVLTDRQKAVQRAIGSAAFPSRVMPAISLVLHRLSCVMARPPIPEAELVLKELYSYMYMNAHADDGITYGGGGMANRDPLTAAVAGNFTLDGGAPLNLEASADATFDNFELIGILITRGGAALHHSTHKVGTIVTCSMGSEAVANTRCGDLVTYVREIENGFGIPSELPTFVATDSLSHERVFNKLANANKSKAFLKQYIIMQQRAAAGICIVGHIPDEQMPADFLTKWIAKKKLLASLRYATNSAAFVPTGRITTA